MTKNRGFENIGRMIQEVANSIILKIPGQRDLREAKLKEAGAGVQSPGLQAKRERTAALAAARIGPEIQKAAYIYILHEAISKAGNAGSFNLESHKAELMKKFGNLSQDKLKESRIWEALSQLEDENDIERAFNIVAGEARALANSSRILILKMNA